MALTTQQKLAIRALWNSDISNRRESIGLTKADVDAAIDAIDTWIDANSTSYNTAIPQPARSALTASQKAELLYRVALKRYGG